MQLDKLDSKFLVHIIELQSCIIEGRNIKAILHKYMDVFRSDTNADIIALCLKEENQVDIKYILEEKKVFSHLIKKYFPERKKFTWEEFIRHCEGRFLPIDHYLLIEHFDHIFNGFIPKKTSIALSKELGLKKAVLMPIYSKTKEDKVGFVIYISLNDTSLDMEKLKMTTQLFQSIFQPLYDREHYTLYSKCVRVNDDMKQLTAQEKRIVKKVLESYTYPEIADQLSISINTLKTHMKNIFNKYDVNSKLELYKKLNVNHS